MHSRLTSLLVRDGLIRIHRMEHVFLRQVIDGGSLDTILLEMELVDDHKLQEYLSLATGLPPQSAGNSNTSTKVLRELCPLDLATQYQVVPVDHSEGALALLVCDPVHADTLEALADALEMSVQPMIVPEYHFKMRFAALYGGEVSERFSNLSKKRSHKPVVIPAKGMASVKARETRADARPSIVETEKNTNTRKLQELQEATTPSIIDSETTEPVDGIPTAIVAESTQPVDTSERVRGTRAPAQQPKRRLEIEAERALEAKEERRAKEALKAKEEKRAKEALKAKEEKRAKEALKAKEEKRAKEALKAKEEKRAKNSNAGQGQITTYGMPSAPTPSVKVGSPDSPSEVSYASITPDEARTLLSTCEDRNQIFIILLRAIRKRARFASLFLIKGESATGRVALSKAGIDNEKIRKLSIPLNEPSRFQLVFKTKAFSVGPLDSDDPHLCELFSGMGGGQVPAAALLLPIVMGNRLIAIAVGHNSDLGISIGSVTELLPLGTATTDAVSRLLAKLRADKEKSNAAAPKNPSTANASSAADNRPKPPVASEAMLALFARIEDGDSKISEAALAEAMKCLPEVLEHLQFGFPGKLTCPRNETDKRLRAREYGPILALVEQIGPRCGPALAEKMRDADREIRYYATICATDLRPADVLNELVERLFDGDESIRALAIEALQGYRTAELNAALDFARKALHSEDNLRLKLAAEGLTRLADTSAIPDLIDAHSRGGDAAEATRRALFGLTNQDFGGSNRQWRAWWDKHQHTHRITWMLEGLSHKNPEIRKRAVDTLRSLTGEYFGYGHDLPKKERDKTRKLWEQWWDKTGKSRFC